MVLLTVTLHKTDGAFVIYVVSSYLNYAYNRLVFRLQISLWWKDACHTCEGEAGARVTASTAVERSPSRLLTTHTSTRYPNIMAPFVENNIQIFYSRI